MLNGPERGDPAFRDLLSGCRWDIDRFSRDMLGVEGHPGQQEFWKAGLMRTPSRWRAAYLTLCISAGNRAGKTLGLAIYLLHSTLYKMGLQPPGLTDRELLGWMSAPYHWYHFGLQLEVAELVHHELGMLLSGIHPAQKGRGCPLTDMLGKAVADWQAKERGDYPWLRLHPALGGGQIHFRSTSERALGALGKEMNGVSWDECAFSNDFQFVVDEVLHLRRLGTGGQMVLISTMTEGITAFSDKWAEGDPEAPDRRPEAMSLRMSTRHNIGYGLDAEVFERLVANTPDYLIPQNIDGYAIEGKSAFFGAKATDMAFDAALPEDEPPQPRHRYVQGVDPALTYDSSWSIVLDITDPERAVGVRARRKTGRQTTLSVAGMVWEGHMLYSLPGNWCATAIDATGFGGAAFRDQLGGLAPLRSVEFGGVRSKKMKLLLDVKDALEKGRLVLPRHGLWLILRRQLLGYKLLDRGLQTDAVMALAVAWSEAKRQPSSPDADASFSYFTPEVESEWGKVNPSRVSVARLILDR